MIQLPAGYAIHGTSNNGNTLTAIKTAESTAAKPILMVIDRSEAVYNQGQKKFSVPTYRVRVIRGTVDVDGVPKVERLMVDATFRTPVGTDSEHSDMLSDFTALVSETDFATDALGDHFFPDEPGA